MLEPICPICGTPLTTQRPAWRCEAGHSFDVAKQGYVNLLPVQQKHSLHPGDTPEQVHARRRFLTAGFYAPIAQSVQELLAGKAANLLDVGCGEGYYLRQLGAAFPALVRWGMDISRDAVRLAAGADKQASYFVGTASRLPFESGSFDAITSLFALTVPEEFHRLLSPGGWYLQALTEDDHLQSLKALIYPELLHREKQLSPELPGFTLITQRDLKFNIMLTSQQQIQDLLAMTPHYWRINKDGAQRAAAASTLHDTAHIRLNLYRANA